MVLPVESFDSTTMCVPYAEPPLSRWDTHNQHPYDTQLTNYLSCRTVSSLVFQVLVKHFPGQENRSGTVRFRLLPEILWKQYC